MISLILILTILVAPLSWNKHAPSAQWLSRLSSIAIIFSGFLITNVFYIDRLYDGLSIFAGFINLNSINQTFQILILIIGGTIVASVINFTNFSLHQLNYLKNYTFIILFNILGAVCLSSAGDLLTLYIAVETQSFSLYILSALKNDSPNSASAGLKYFLIGSLASTIILLGIALFYHATGLTNFESIFVYYSITDWFSLDGFSGGYMEPNSPYNHSMSLWNFAEHNSYYLIGILSIILIISGILIKIGAAPFHQWSIDVYSLVPTTITTWLVILPKIALFAFLYQFLGVILENGNAMLYSSANNSIIEWMLETSVQDHINWLTKENILNIDYFTNLLNNYYYDNLVLKIKNIYGDITHFYPHLLQVELLNTINSPIINQSNYNFITPYEYDNIITSIWNDYNTNMHNSLYYSFNIEPLGSITIKNYLIFIAVISLIIGAIGGLYQVNIKRLLAFSAINHVGFLLLALSINNKISLDSFIFYLGQYSLTNLNIFLILIAFGYLNYINSINDFVSKTQTNNHFIGPVQKIFTTFLNSNTRSGLTNNNSFEIWKDNITNIKSLDLNYINQLTGLFVNNPILTLSFVISLFSMAGIPPMMGFFAKQQILLSAISVGFLFVAIIAINTSVISAYYYLKLIQVSTFTNSSILSKLTHFKLSTSSTSKLLKKNENKTPSQINVKANTEDNLMSTKSDFFAFNTILASKSNNLLDVNNNLEQKINIIPNFYSSKKLDSNFFTSSINLNISAQTEESSNITNNFYNKNIITNNINSYLISIFTLIILLYTLKPNLLINLTSILSSYSFSL